MIDIEKFICSLLADHPVGVTVREDIHKALKDQGLEYKGGKIMSIEDKTALQESKDEKIRKAIYKCVEWFGFDSCFFKDVSQKECLAWLEKQSEHQKFRDSIQVGDKVTRNKDGILVNLSQLNRVAKKDNKQSEKGTNGNEREIPNSEQKPTGKVEPIEWSGKIKSRKVEGVLKKMLDEKIKSADKVEPKFKVGDTMRTLQEAVEGYTDGMPVVISVDKKYYHCTNELIAIKDQDDYEFPPINVKQKPADKIK